MEDRRFPGGPLTSETFGKGVNDYLNLYVTLADAKAAGFLAAALTVGAALFKVHPSTSLGNLVWWSALGALSGSSAASSFAIFPRLPSGRRGLIFWEDIRSHATFDDYQNKVGSLTIADVEM